MHACVSLIYLIFSGVCVCLFVCLGHQKQASDWPTQARDCVTMGPTSRGRKRGPSTALNADSKNLPACVQPEQLPFTITELPTGYGPPICTTRTIYLPQSRAAHRQKMVPRVWEARACCDPHADGQVPRLLPPLLTSRGYMPQDCKAFAISG